MADPSPAEAIFQSNASVIAQIRADRVLKADKIMPEVRETPLLRR